MKFWIFGFLALGRAEDDDHHHIRKGLRLHVFILIRKNF